MSYRFKIIKKIRTKFINLAKYHDKQYLKNVQTKIINFNLYLKIIMYIETNKYLSKYSNKNIINLEYLPKVARINISSAHL